MNKNYRFSVSNSTKIQFLTLFNHLVLLTGMFYTHSWSYLIIGIIIYVFVGLFSANIAMHRYLSHGSFSTTSGKDKFLKWISILACFGSPVSWCALHRHHHKHSDTENDIQNPKVIGALKSWASLYPRTKISPKLISDLLKDKDIKIIHKYYFKIIAALMLFWFVVDPLLLVWVFCFPAVLCFHGAATIGVIPHYKWTGYRVVESNDDSVNSPLASLLSLGEGWHNYHHHNSRDYRHGHEWWEIDPSAWIIEKVFLK